MTLAFRLIARLDIRNDGLIKTIRCEGVRKLGDPRDYAARYDAQGIDEIYYLDTVASLYGRNSLAELVERGTESAFVPVTVAGGIGSVDEAIRVLRFGADKIGLNTAAVRRPDLLSDLAAKGGRQVVVLQLDAKRKGDSWEAYTHGGREPSGKDAIAWAEEAVSRGAGEVLATSIDREGTRAGLDIELMRQLAHLPVPVVLCGGVGCAAHTVEAWQAGASGVAMAGALHYNRVTLDELRRALSEAGAHVRWSSVLSPEPAASSDPICAKP